MFIHGLNLSVITICKNLMRKTHMIQTTDIFGKFVFNRLFKVWAQIIITVSTFSDFFSPLTAIVDAWNARHCSQKCVDSREVAFIFQNTCDTVNIVIVTEGKQMAASVQCPVFVGKLSVEGKTDLTQVVIVKRGIDAFTALIVGDRVKQMIIHKYIVVTADHFSDEQEIRMRCTDMITKFPHELSLIHI